MIARLYRMLVERRARRCGASAGEMYAVFQEARDDARREGVWAHARFCAREIAGLLAVPVRLPRLVPWALAGLVVAAAVSYFYPEQFVSTALVRTVPAMIPPRYAPAMEPIDAAALVRETTNTILSRNGMLNLIQTYDLYRAERARMPMEDVVEIMQRAIEIRASEARSIRIAFVYSDPHLAQKVCRDLMTRLVDETLRFRATEASMTVQFLKDQAEQIGTEWQSLSAKVRAAVPGDPARERLLMDTDLARKQYESARIRLSEALLVQRLEERRQGPTLEVLDLPSLPERPQLSRLLILAAGLALGLAAGLIAGLLRPKGPLSPMRSTFAPAR